MTLREYRYQIWVNDCMMLPVVVRGFVYWLVVMSCLFLNESG